MDNEKIGFVHAVKEGIGEIAAYPIEHPIKTAKAVVMGGALVIGSVFASQLSMLIAEHGGTRQRSQQTETQATAEETDERQA